MCLFHGMLIQRKRRHLKKELSMPIRNTPDTYGSVAKWLHWSIALIVLFMLLLGFLMGNASNPTFQGILYTLHKSTGLTFLFLVIIRLLWRMTNVQPKLPSSVPQWQQFAARLNHLLLYTVLFCMPLSGWIFSTAAGKPVNFWWLVTIPCPYVPISPTLTKTVSDLHEILAYTLIALITLHLCGIFKHLNDREFDVITRMLSSRRQRADR